MFLLEHSNDLAAVRQRARSRSCAELRGLRALEGAELSVRLSVGACAAKLQSGLWLVRHLTRRTAILELETGSPHGSPSQPASF